MGDNLETVWDAEPHTLAKLEILKNYLGAWMPIMAHRAAYAPSKMQEVLYVDGFAGPGRYRGGEDGSPIVALKTALGHPLPFPTPIRFIFVELDPARCAALGKYVLELKPRTDLSFKVKVDPPIQGDCNNILSDLLQRHEATGTRFGPALVFLDQFGYSAVPMQLIAKIMDYPSCEVFSYLEARRLIQFMEDSTKWPSIDAAFGDAQWRDAISAPVGARSRVLLQTYKESLKLRGKAKYVSHFSMHDSNGVLIYWLFFCTNHLRGLEVMKKAMWSVDEKGTFRFSDSDNPDQVPLFLTNTFSDQWLADNLWSTFRGATITGAKFKEHVLVSTPCYQYRPAFQLLHKGGRIKCQPQSARTTLEDSLEITFVNPPKQAQQTMFLDLK